MYCPNCAKENSPEQKFCRACGFNLEKSIESFLEQRPDFVGVSNSQISRVFETVGKIGFGGLIGGGIIGVLILIWVIFKKFIESGQTDQILLGVFSIVLVLSAVMGLAYVIFQEYVKEKKKEVTVITQKEIEIRQTAKLLEDKTFTPIPSITEETTDLLFAETLKTKTSDDPR